MADSRGTHGLKLCMCKFSSEFLIECFQGVILRHVRANFNPAATVSDTYVEYATLANIENISTVWQLKSAFLNCVLWSATTIKLPHGVTFLVSNVGNFSPHLYSTVLDTECLVSRGNWKFHGNSTGIPHEFQWKFPHCPRDSPSGWTTSPMTNGEVNSPRISQGNSIIPHWRILPWTFNWTTASAWKPSDFGIIVKAMSQRLKILWRGNCLDPKRLHVTFA